MTTIPPGLHFSFFFFPKADFFDHPLRKTHPSPAAKMAEERALHEAKLAKMENEMKMVFQQKVNEKEAKLKQSEEELYARHREMKEALEKQRLELEDKKRRIEQGRPLTPEKVRFTVLFFFCALVCVDDDLGERCGRR